MPKKRVKINPKRKQSTTDRISADQCNVCGYTSEDLKIDKHYAYLAGHYCSTKCYQTLFDDCKECGKKNMSVVSNAKSGKGNICDECYMKANGLHVVTIGGWS